MTDTQGRWYAGGCHCGSVRFKVLLLDNQAIQCNCSMCAKKGFINLIATPERFVLEQGADNLATYRFNTEVAEHRFCKTCGIHPFSRPRSHPGGYDVNARCLYDGYEFLAITPFDGQNWEANVHAIRD